MLIVAGSFVTQPGGRDALLDAARPMVAATRAEPGCRDYVFSPDPDDPDRTMLFEIWDDQAALDAHFATEHMATFRAALESVPITGRDVFKYTIADVGPVP